MKVNHDFRIMVRTEERGTPVCSNEELIAYFSMFGQVSDSYSPNRHPDMAFVTVQTQQELQAALADPRPIIAGKQCNLQQAFPKGGPQDDKSAGGAPQMQAQLGMGGGDMMQAQLGGMGGMGMGCGAGGMNPNMMPLGQPQQQAQMQAGTRLQVTQLNETINEDMLRTYFSYFGPVKDAFIPVDQMTRQRGTLAFVTMASPNDAASVLSLPTHQITEQTFIMVTMALEAAPMQMQVQPQMQQQMLPPISGAPSAAGTRLHVTHLNETISEDMLRTYFNYFGPVRDAYIPMDKVTLQRKPFAFVTMASAEDAGVVLQFPSHQITEQCSINVCLARQEGLGGCGGGMGAVGGMMQPMQPMYGAGGMGGGMCAQPLGMMEQPMMQALPAGGGGSSLIKQGVPGEHRLYVFGMPEGLNGDHLRGHFARHGEILDVYVPKGKPDNAYITFETEEQLNDAIATSGNRIAGMIVQGMKKPDGARKGRSTPY